MKKKFYYLLLIIVSIVGSRLIFGKDYHLNSDSLFEENLYVYKIFDTNKVLTTYVDEEEFYYVTSINEKNKANQYSVIKYNLTRNRKESEYIFNSDEELVNVNLFKQNGYLYLTSKNSKTYYKFDQKLNVISKNNFDVSDADIYGIHKDKVFYTINNTVYYNNELYDSVPASCGANKDIIYGRNTYLHFYNEKTGFGCLYNLVDKKLEYLDYENADVIKNRLLEYQNNRLSFKYGGTTYYFNDITESNNIKMHDSSDYLFTIDTANNKLKIYNIESRKIIYEKTVESIKGAVISNIMIDDYVFFLVNKDNSVSLYVWDYLKEIRHSYDMIDYNEKEYKFKNNELKEEIKNNYNIDVYIYDQAVDYFYNYYVVPSYDDILINSRLLTLKEILDSFDKDKVTSISNIKIFFDKDIVSTYQEEPSPTLTVFKDKYSIIAINITNDNFKDNIINELTGLYPNLIENMEYSD